MLVMALQCPSLVYGFSVLFLTFLHVSWKSSGADALAPSLFKASKPKKLKKAIGKLQEHVTNLKNIKESLSILNFGALILMHGQLMCWCL